MYNHITTITIKTKNVVYLSQKHLYSAYYEPSRALSILQVLTHVISVTTSEIKQMSE